MPSTLHARDRVGQEMHCLPHALCLLHYRMQNGAQATHRLKSVLLGVMRLSGAPFAAPFAVGGCSTVAAALQRSRTAPLQHLLLLLAAAKAVPRVWLGRGLAARKALDAAACRRMGHLHIKIEVQCLINFLSVTAHTSAACSAHHT